MRSSALLSFILGKHVHSALSRFNQVSAIAYEPADAIGEGQATGVSGAFGFSAYACQRSIRQGIAVVCNSNEADRLQSHEMMEFSAWGRCAVVHARALPKVAPIMP